MSFVYVHSAGYVATWCIFSIFNIELENASQLFFFIYVFFYRVSP